MMAVVLIPVIEINGNYAGLSAPDQYSYWQNAEVWDVYRALALAQAGYPDKMLPYYPGSALFQLTDISDGNLIKLIMDHTAELRAGNCSREEAIGLFGGYVLRVEGEDKFWPQCCGTLSDIVYWERVAAGYLGPYDGHPASLVNITKSTLVLNFSVRVWDEAFEPPPPNSVLEISRTALQAAVADVLPALAIFAQRLIKLNEMENLGIR